MKKNQCLFCRSLRCFERVVSSEDDGKAYDQIACNRHIKDLHKHADETAKGIKKLWISSTGNLERGKSISRELEQLKDQGEEMK